MPEHLKYNLVSTLGPSFLIGSSSFLQVTRTTINSSQGFEFRPDRTPDSRVNCPCSTANIKAMRVSLWWCCVYKLSPIPKLQSVSVVYENQ